MKLGDSYLKLGKQFNTLAALVGNHVHHNMLISSFLKFAFPRTLEWFATTPSTWDFYLPKLDSTL
jgi:hypothetical protein